MRLRLSFRLLLAMALRCGVAGGGDGFFGCG